ncbi:hypothetical protein DH2020_038295 [Rehmannia glutinosa]|uniref:PPPDE domain-containing protein n=1 Tax=Rehmannia glutinosa TaxID=99300 RepID=A0ABR0UZT2_REHGL
MHLEPMSIPQLGFLKEPKQCDGFTFRKSILIGWTEMTLGEVRTVMEKLAEKYRGDAYNLITKNCNHFCNDACIKLTGNPIPNWINRLARIVRHLKMEEDKACEGEKKKLKSCSNRFTNSSSDTSSSSPCSSPRDGSRSRSSLTPLSPLVLDNSNTE